MLSLPLVFVLEKVIEHKVTILFWSYFALMAVYSLIAKWYIGEEHKNKFVSTSVHIAMICAITLFLWGAYDYLRGTI